MVDKPELGELSPDVVAIVIDIDGTLSDAPHHGVSLGGYVQRELGDWIQNHADSPAVCALRDAIAELEGASTPDTVAVVETAFDWIRAHRQHPALERVLGALWCDGYASGALDNTLNDDPAAQFVDWAQDRRAMFVYSSRPRVAQRALFTHSDRGDLGDLFAGYFDTRMGAPDAPATYTTIAGALGEIPASVLLVSATGDRLDAAKSAGWQTCWMARDDDTATRAHENGGHPIVDMFTAIELL